jgi:SSS family solute:Na+ symporter
MAQNLWMAIFAWSTCFVVTLLVSMATRPRPEEELRGLVYSLTPRVIDSNEAWFKRPAVLACIVGVFVIILNVIFW